jgi:hypothetical protein
MNNVILLMAVAALIPISSGRAQTLAMDAFQQNAGDPPGYAQKGPRPFQGRMMKDSEIRRQLEQIKIWQMTKEMNLPTDKAEKFFPLYNKYTEEMRTITTERVKAINALDSSMRDNVGDAEINAQIKRILDYDDELASTHAKFISALGGILSPTEVARYMVFEQRFDREIRERIRGMMMRHRMEGPGR